MLNYLKLYWKIGKKELDALPASIRKIAAVCCGISFLGIIILINYICNFFLQYVSAESVMQYGLFFLLYAGIIYLPAGIYKNFFENSKIEILLLAPIKTWKAYSYSIILELIKKAGIFSIIFSFFILFFQKQNISIGYSLFSLIGIWINIYLFFLSIIGILYIYFGKKAKGIYFTITGICEVLGFILCYWLIDGKWKPFILNKVYEYINEQNMIFIYSGYFIMVVLYFLNTRLLQKTLEVQGIIKSSPDMQCEEKHSRIKDCFLKKDIKLFIRDLERMKYVLVTIIIFFATTVLGGKSVAVSSAVIMVVLFAATVSIQINYDNYQAEKEKLDLMFMADLKVKNFLEHKTKFSYAASSIMIFTYSFALYLCCDFRISEVKNFIAAVLFIMTLMPRMNAHLLLQLVLMFYKKDIRAKDYVRITRKILKIALGNAAVMIVTMIVVSVPAVFGVKCMVFVIVEEAYRLMLKNKAYGQSITA